MNMKKKRLYSIILLVLLMVNISTSAFAFEPNYGVAPAAHDVEYRRELVGSATFLNYPVGYAKGQPANGTIFTSPGGFYWSDGGLFTSVDCSFSATWGIVSASISVGETGTLGNYISAPVNTRCKLFVFKDIVVQRYAHYERLRGSTGAWRFTGYEDVVYSTGCRLAVTYGPNFSTIWEG